MTDQIIAFEELKNIQKTGKEEYKFENLNN